MFRASNLTVGHAARCRTAKGYCVSAEPNIRDRLRALLRETAQSVAVITSNMPPEIAKDTARYHGATLSSFTSIAMNPYPLVTFSLRTPSRMAASLKSCPSHIPSHMVINILSATQASAAITFSRPDLYPNPFSSVAYFLSGDGLPILEGSLGALSCKMVSLSLPLHDLDYLEKRSDRATDEALQGHSGASELFIARVVRVEELGDKDADKDVGRPEMLPLLYHRQGFTSCKVPPHSGLTS
jgi:flavin reductase (DIM6/NTAB) family NADH-FMN oxidoreductase RutF